jgi:hypothetical protein
MGQTCWAQSWRGGGAGVRYRSEVRDFANSDSSFEHLGLDFAL